MKNISRKFNIVIYEPHLLGNIKDLMRLLDKYGKYFYIRHTGENITPHYHIYYLSRNHTKTLLVKELFEEYIANRVFVDTTELDRECLVEYFLCGGEYSLSDIVSTMTLK